MTTPIIFLLLQSAVFVGPQVEKVTSIVTMADPNSIAAQHIGILIQAENPMQAQRHIGYAFGYAHSKGVPQLIKNVRMPCGTKRAFTLADFPHSDMPCPCGKKGHWLVKFEFRHRDYKK